MTGRIFRVERGAARDGQGLRTVVFLAGCPHRCAWCHNPEGLTANSPQAYDITAAELLEIILEDQSFYRFSGGGVTFSGGEPLRQTAFLQTVLRLCRQHGIPTAIETAAAIPGCLSQIIEDVDHVIADLKIMDPVLSQQYCAIDPSVVQANLQTAAAAGKPLTIRIPLIPKLTASATNLAAILTFLQKLPRQNLKIELLEYHNLARHKYQTVKRPFFDAKALSLRSMRAIRGRFAAAGLAVTLELVRPQPDKPAGRLSKRNAFLLRRARKFADNRGETDRARFYTRGWQLAGDAGSVILRRARALAYTLDHAPVKLWANDVIAGMAQRKIPGPPGVADGFSYVSQVSAPEQWSVPLTCPSVDPEILSELRYWETGRMPLADDPGEALIAAYVADGTIDGLKNYFGHLLPDFAAALRLGYRQIAERAALEAANETGGKRDFLLAVAVTAGAAGRYGLRYARLARSQARRCPRRRDELLTLAEICERVPAEPPETFAQALQMVYFVNFFNEEESPAVRTHSFGRIDQYLWPYYVADIRQHRLTPAQAQELIEAFFIKCYRTFDEANTMLGGLTPTGENGENDLSFLMLAALRNLKTPRSLSARLHAKSTPEWYRALAETLRCGLGVPALYNDEVIIPALTGAGLTPQDARNYAVTGCVELIGDPGRSDFRTVSAFVNMAKVIDRVLHQSSAGTFAQLLKELKDETCRMMKVICRGLCRREEWLARYLPVPLLSSLSEDCLAKCTDITAGGCRNNYAGICLGEIASSSNILYAVKTLVFDRKQLTLTGLCQILDDNFAGHEPLRRQLQKLPKFGCGTAVNPVAQKLLDLFGDALTGQPHFRPNGKYLPLIFSRQHRQNVLFGRRTPATTDGRKAGEDLAISLNPAPGSGPADIPQIFHAQNTLDLSRIAGGVSNNLDLDPSLDTGRLGALLQAWQHDGGYEAAFTLIDPAELLDARQHPERHRDLSIRVYGFNEYFINLDRPTQNNLIARSQLSCSK